MNSAQLRELLEKHTKEARAILTVADDEKRDLTEAEEKEYTEIDKTIDATRAKLKRAVRLEEIEAESRVPVNKLPDEIANTDDVNVKAEPNADEKDFRSMEDFIESVVYHRNDPRLTGLAQENVGTEERLHSMGVGTEGGFLVPQQFMDTLLSVSPDDAKFRSRSRVLPAGTPPDAALTIPALDQSAGSNVYGGATVAWLAEGAAKTETNVRVREITLTPKEVAAYVTLTDKLMRNAPAMTSLLTAQMQMAMVGATEDAYYNGNGVGKPLGVLQSPARITYSRATANTIVVADVIGMFARLLMRGGSPVWIGSQTILPQLMTMVDPGSGGTMVWQPSAREGLPGTLFGMPMLFSERSVALGTAGDLILVDMANYLIKDGSGPFVAASEHVNFLNNKTVIKIFWNVDGQSWLTAPLGLEGSTGNTVSPFVVLGA